ncbi:MAG TPA: YvcK family protein [Deltaproteobacteria bacterium]|nr:YvcK family protein [Deltaproteobacteria bacterium]HQI81962.1 YvcK family protein [Deltaproteobacteria bacterium]
MSTRSGSKRKIVTIGGGTGSFVVLSGLKSFPVDISAIVGMFDDGGSTGVLRKDLNVLPPGDVRQCLAALSEPDHPLREVLEYRFSEGFLSGHSLGNIILSALEKNTGSMARAIDALSALMNITHGVIPVTLQQATLCASFESGEKILGQDTINKTSLSHRPFRLELVPKVEINPRARKAILEADTIVLNPGDLYTSIIPNFLVQGMKEALLQSQAQIIHVANIMSTHGHTDRLTVVDHQRILAGYMHPRRIDCVIYNTAVPNRELFHAYNAQNQHPVEPGDLAGEEGVRFIGEDLIDRKIYRKKAGDTLQRSFIRHNAARLAEIICEL